ncbi:hybrid sensor histidine kinase/response regulator [Aliagarivorans taiwanensis]|uniref:hybrid sensor histidine kinase/response regulator n=1 Tax=Aliagarivorans taiwanensis TaxID=561966 RepID=UPI00041A5CC5|nr:ATP-binding protein [Aliagarivorans taiwanensis]
MADKFSKLKMLLILAISLCLLAIGAADLKRRLAVTYQSASVEIGHALISERDRILAHQIDASTPALELSSDLVAIQLRAREAKQHLEKVINSRLGRLLFNEHQWHRIKQTFYGEAYKLLEEMENNIRLNVARTFLERNIKNLLLAESGKSSDELTDMPMLTQLLQQGVIDPADEASQTLLRYVGLYNQLKQSQNDSNQILLGENLVRLIDENEHFWFDVVAASSSDVDFALALTLLMLFIYLLVDNRERLLLIGGTLEELEQRTKEANAANEAKSLFLASMSHELRTPLNGVLGIAQVMASGECNAKQQREYLDVILESGNHLMAILNDILDFSKVEQNRLELEEVPFTLKALLSPIHSTFSSLAEEKHLTLQFNVDVDEQYCYLGDAARLRQVVYNLLSNAIKFTERGEVLFTVSSGVMVGNKRTLNFVIKDSGIGIPSDRLDSIFDPFVQAEGSTTRRFGGTGLGLAIVRRLIVMMNGEISVTSETGVGSEFRFSVALPELPKEQLQQRSLDVQVLPQGLSILVVEDNRVNAMVMTKFCQRLGHRCSVVENGRLALEILAERSFDLIIMDNHMPEMNGVDATRAIRQQLGLDILIFACTADVFEQARDEFIEAGANHILTKPLQETAFSEALALFSDRLPSNDDLPVLADSDEQSDAESLSKDDIAALDSFADDDALISSEALVDSDASVGSDALDDNNVLLDNETQQSAPNDDSEPLPEDQLIWQVLMDIADQEADIALELAEAIVTSFDEYLGQLQPAFERHDWELLHRIAHSIKGSAGNFALDYLSHCASEVVDAAIGEALTEPQLQAFIALVERNRQVAQGLIDQHRQ